MGNANNNTSYAWLAAVLSGSLTEDGATAGNYLRKGFCPFQLYQQVLPGFFFFRDGGAHEDSELVLERVFVL